MTRPLIAGNWKMNGLRAEGAALARAVVDGLAAGGQGHCDWLICPPATLLQGLAPLLEGSALALGGQDCHVADSGAHTGDISATMLADSGCRYVIVGHSERRQNHAEGDDLVRAKAEAAQSAGLVPIVCVGETKAEREAGRALEVVEAQLRGSLPAAGSPGGALVVAYEPVWAIGTGLTPTAEDVAQVHGHIGALLSALYDASTAAAIRVLYGGSVKPGNAAELLAIPRVEGALIGGASLKSEDFLAIGAAAPAGL